MDKIILKKATKVVKPLKGFLYGPTKSGKTYSSLMIANGFVQSLRNCTQEEAWQHIIVLDTEQGRAALYAGIGEYNHHDVKPPYNTEKLSDYISQINLMDEIDVIIIDSLTHFWSKKGGILEQKTALDAQGGNSYTNWNLFTAKFNSVIDDILASPKYVLTTARAKSDTVLVPNDKGKMEPRTYGLKPDIRDGFEYECDFTFNIDQGTHEILVEKIIPGMELSYPAATPELGKLIYQLQMDKAITIEREFTEIAESIRKLSATYGLIQFVQLQLSGRKLDPEQIDYESLVKLEQNLINEIKKKQAKK